MNYLQFGQMHCFEILAPTKYRDLEIRVRGHIQLFEMRHSYSSDWMRKFN